VTQITRLLSTYASLVPTVFVLVHQDAWHLYDFIVYDEIIQHVLDIYIKANRGRDGCYQPPPAQIRT